MSKIIKVTIQFEDYILSVEGIEAEKWQEHSVMVAQFAQLHGCNPYDTDPIKWSKKPLNEVKTANKILCASEYEKCFYWRKKTTGCLKCKKKFKLKI